MNKYIIIVSVIVISCLLGYAYYNSQIITTYYSVSIYPPVSYDKSPKVEIHETPQYENDSSAISIEQYTYQFMQERWEKERVKSIEQNNGREDEVYKRWRDEQKNIIKLAHKRNFDVEKLQEKIVKYGLRSYEVDIYCKENEVELSIFPLLSKY